MFTLRGNMTPKAYNSHMDKTFEPAKHWGGEILLLYPHRSGLSETACLE